MRCLLFFTYLLFLLIIINLTLPSSLPLGNVLKRNGYLDVTLLEFDFDHKATVNSIKLSQFDRLWINGLLVRGILKERFGKDITNEPRLNG